MPVSISMTNSLRIFGKLMTATLENGDPLTFRAIHDVENVLEDTNGVSVIVSGEVLIVSKDVAKDLIQNTPITMSDDRVYRVREILFVDDGEMARVSIVAEDDEC